VSLINFPERLRNEAAAAGPGPQMKLYARGRFAHQNIISMPGKGV
jgi:hypothetical protein